MNEQELNTPHFRAQERVFLISLSMAPLEMASLQVQGE